MPPLSQSAKATRKQVLVGVLLAVSLASVARTQAPVGDPLESYNVTWQSPSESSLGSMPIGNGDIGLNVWAETGGGLVFYISKTDAWDSDCELVKLGRVRIEFSSNPFAKGQPFRQTLRLREGEIEFAAGDPAAPISLRLWVDANRPAIHLEAESANEFRMTARVETWRREDAFLASETSPVVWYQRNPRSIWAKNLERWGETKALATGADPLRGRTFGAALLGSGFVRQDERTLGSARPAKRQQLVIVPLTSQADTVEQWAGQLRQLVAAVEAVPLDQARVAHRQWWNEFWNRSWIHVASSPATAGIGRSYQLQRFINACGGRGAFPIKFNGSIFTFDGLAALDGVTPIHADCRTWGGAYWQQNTRLTYWPMLAAGDFDLMQPWFRMFANALPLAQERTRALFGHDGAFFPETMWFWGNYYTVPVAPDKPRWFIDNPNIQYHYQGGLELVAMMLDYYADTQDRAFLNATLLPLADAILTFFDKHYSRDASGKLRLAPAQALEGYFDGVNPTPEIAGLRWVLGRLLELPPELVGNRGAAWQRLLEAVPPIPLKEVNGKKFVLPIESAPMNFSCENPELYTVFPYRFYGVGKPEIEIGRNTFAQRRFDGYPWNQSSFQAAYLGLTELAKQRLLNWFPAGPEAHSLARFPAFWRGSNSHMPDQDYGGVGGQTLQAMLLQVDNGKIWLFPAWPRDWDVDFKLHAPQNTTVAATYRQGKLEKLVVTPEIRAKDVINLLERPTS